MIVFTKAAGKKIKSTVMVYLNGRIATSIGVFGRMVNLMAKDGCSFQMKLAVARNLRTES
jgi:hypothetical protein